ncbi:MAG: winged helix DNA-binding protein [Desulfobacterales bacterium]|jgi:lambda repressor-like predicted transcriptional regulator|nr:winged helix DNA-binding protein [Desulfobacterales bacterium]
MTTLQNDIRNVSRALLELNRRLVAIAARIERQGLVAADARRGGRMRNAAVRRDTVLESVYAAIRRSRNGASIAQLKHRTRLEDRQLSNALYKLTRKGIIHARSRGVYVKS